MSPLFRLCVASVYERLTGLSKSQRLTERRQYPLESPITDPLLKSAVARLVRRVLLWEISPWRPGPENPHDGIEYQPCWFPGTSSPVGTHDRQRNQRFNDQPLRIRKLHPQLRSDPLQHVDHDHDHDHDHDYLHERERDHES